MNRNDASAADIAVVVCTRNRAELLRGCLASIAALNPVPSEVVVIDNASSDESTCVLAESFGFRCVVEPRTGLDRARNRGLAETSADIVAYLDDDTRPAPWWAGVVHSIFADPTVGAASGLVLADELTTWAQREFERHQGMSKGLVSQIFDRSTNSFGFEPQRAAIGANFAFRRSVVEELGGFDTVLDLGTPTRGGGDLDMVYRVHEAGERVCYEPAMFVRHVHRSDLTLLWQQFVSYGVGYRAFLEKQASRSPEHRAEVRRFVRRWHVERHVKALAGAIVRADPYRVMLALAEAWGSRRGVDAYRRSRAAEDLDSSASLH